jgi:hypothetical protein
MSELTHGSTFYKNPMNTAIKSAFEKYVREPNPTANVALEAFVAVFNHHVLPGCEPHVSRAAFTAILGSGKRKLRFKSMSKTRSRPLKLEKAKRIERIALTFDRLSNEPGVFGGVKRKLSWDALDEDAKGWCENLLLASIPRNASFDVKEALMRAKETIAKMLVPLIPKGSRNDPPYAGRKDILEVKVDE